MNKFARIIVSSLFLCVSSVYADIQRVSVSSSGEQANNGSSIGIGNGGSLSSDGRFVAFTSGANNLVPGDTNIANDAFIHDRDTGITERVSISSTGEQGNGSSVSTSISANGRYVAIFSRASNLVGEDTNDFGDIFVHDRETQITERVSVSSTGEQGNGLTGSASISADGRYVAFVSLASNLVPEDTNTLNDIFVHDRETGTTERVSVSSTGEQGNGVIIDGGPSISTDGRYVAFMSSSSNLVPGDTNNADDVFIHDRESKTTELISMSSSAEQGNSSSGFPSISADGRYVAFVSFASNLVPEDTNNSIDIFVHDRDMETTERVSVSSNSEQGNSSSDSSPGISADGRYVTFFSRASNLVVGDTNDRGDIFVHDREARITERASESSTGEQGNRSSGTANISTDGRYVAFNSVASNLVLEDTNSATDIFVTDNPLLDSENDLIIVEKMINNQTRETQDKAAQLLTGTQYGQSYKVTNSSTNRIYRVQVFEGGNPVCNLYALNPGESRKHCNTYQTVLEGDQHTQVKVTAKVSDSGDVLTNYTNTYYTGLTNVTGNLRVTHRINNINADTASQAPTLGSHQAKVLFKIENTGDIELYKVKTYQDPVSPVNSGWVEQCIIGHLEPGQVRYCKKDITLTEAGLNKAMGRVQGRNAIRNASNVINASNPTYFIVP